MDGYSGDMPGDGRRYLAIYLNDHLAGATGAVQMIQRAAKQYEGGDLGAFFAGIGGEIEEDRTTLKAIMDRNGIPQQPHKRAAGWIAEKAGRLKFNGALVRRSPLTPLVELETLAVGIQGKLLLWQTLQAVPPDPATAAQVDYLIERAEQQFQAVAERRIEAGRSALRSAPAR
jgi:hypothetical protein